MEYFLYHMVFKLDNLITNIALQKIYEERINNMKHSTEYILNFEIPSNINTLIVAFTNAAYSEEHNVIIKKNATSVSQPYFTGNTEHTPFKIKFYNNKIIINSWGVNTETYGNLTFKIYKFI